MSIEQSQATRCFDLASIWDPCALDLAVIVGRREIGMETSMHAGICSCRHPEMDIFKASRRVMCQHVLGACRRSIISSSKAKLYRTAHTDFTQTHLIVPQLWRL
jgi:hypothetical protein